MATLSADALVTWEYLAEHLKQKSELVNADTHAFGVGLINAVSARANTLTRRKLKSRAYVITLDGNGSDVILLPEYPVTGVAELRIDTAREFGDETIIDLGDYEVYDGDGRLWYPAGFPRARRSVKVSYTAGYINVPEDLQLAVVEAVAYTWKRMRSKSVGALSVSTGDGMTTQYEPELPTSAYKAFLAYRREDV
jgi:hypothetical protein